MTNIPIYSPKLEHQVLESIVEGILQSQQKCQKCKVLGNTLGTDWVHTVPYLISHVNIKTEKL